MSTIRIEFDDLPEFYSLKVTTKSRSPKKLSDTTFPIHDKKTTKQFLVREIFDNFRRPKKSHVIRPMRITCPSPTTANLRSTSKIVAKNERRRMQMFTRPTSPPMLAAGILSHPLSYINFPKALSSISYPQATSLSSSLQDAHLNSPI